MDAYIAFIQVPIYLCSLLLCDDDDDADKSFSLFLHK